jgi:hypothetical protein
MRDIAMEEAFSIPELADLQARVRNCDRQRFALIAQTDS